MFSFMAANRDEFQKTPPSLALPLQPTLMYITFYTISTKDSNMILNILL